MSKLSKLIHKPRQTVKDSALFRKLVPSADKGEVSGRSEGDREQLAAEDKPASSGRVDALSESAASARPAGKQHPLPTLNLAEERQLSSRELELTQLSREYLKFQCTPAVRDRVIARISDFVMKFMVENGFGERDYKRDILDFLEGCEANPALGHQRTTSAGSLLWLFLLVRTVDPRVVVESGVFKGASLFTLRSASKDAAIYAYDVDLSNLMYAHSSISFHEGDWSEDFPTPQGPSDFCYFDDHINNCLRTRQAYDLGFRHLVFDDSPEIGQLHKWRFPGVPTIQMVMNETLQPGEYVEWVWKNKKLRYTFQEADTHGVKDIVEQAIELPRLDAFTGQPSGIQTYVRLKQRPAG